MMAPGARAVSSPGLRASLGPPAEEEPSAAPEEGKVFSLDENWGELGASWGQEEERCEEESPEEATRPAARARLGCRERAAARGEGQEEAVPGEEG